MNKDLTKGDPGKVLRAFCLPLFGSVIFQQLYNLADSFVAGRFIGENALASVGNSYEITLIFIAFAFGCNISCSIVSSEFFGAKNYSSLKTCISTAAIASSMICALLMTIGLFGGSALLHLINTPDQLLKDSELYLRIYTLGLPFVFFYNISTGIFSALGDSKTPFYFLAASSLSNIAVDILFVAIFDMGVAGVAWATFICQSVSCMLALVFVFLRIKDLPAAIKPPVFSGAILRKLTVIAVPSILQQSFISIGNIIIQSVINGFGAGAIAGYSAGVKLNNLVITSFTTIGNGISNYTAQNLGAGQKQRLRPGLHAGLRLVWCLCIPMALIYVAFPKALLSIFMDNPSPEALRAGSYFLRILAPFYFVVSTKLVSDGILRGSAEMRKFSAGTFLDLILRVVLAFVFSSTALGIIGVWCAWPIGWTLSTALSLFFCLRLPTVKKASAA